LLGGFADQRACQYDESFAYPASQSAAQRSGDRSSESGRGYTNSGRYDHVLLTVLGFSAIRGRSHAVQFRREYQRKSGTPSPDVPDSLVCDPMAQISQRTRDAIISIFAGV